MLEALQWRDEALATRAFTGGTSVAFTAPIDALYAATEINEWAIESADAALKGCDEDPGAFAADGSASPARSRASATRRCWPSPPPRPSAA